MSAETPTGDEELDPEIEAEIQQQRRKIFFAGWQRQSRDLGNHWLLLSCFGLIAYAVFWLQQNWPFADGLVAAWDQKSIAFALLCGLATVAMFIRAGYVWAIYAALLIYVAVLAVIPGTLVVRFLVGTGFLFGLLYSYQALRVARLLRQFNVPLRSS